MSSASATNRLTQAVSSRSVAGARLSGGEDLEKKRTSTTLSVLVPVYNEQFLVEASLARLQVLNESPLLQAVKVIVVDDGSSDATAEALARFRERLKSAGDAKLTWVWIRHDTNRGKGAAIRTALANADT